MQSTREAERVETTRYPPNKLRYRSDEASVYLEAHHGVKVAPATLDKLRCVGGGPEFQKFGRSALYHRERLDAWALEKLGQPLRNTSRKGRAA